ncbi:uncharacterized protein L3040_007074 [Drepanopeziza brunnea f. sp. 'multigermtubi']|uniref:Uncharacterized protein n=1 Tax=Marssonina brunnea f. sp. multigermtubi (strain MB_m1) TaxID=1072389 RepID=K1WJG1_MARBU|nr:uncharacterized protein MBM_08753 [Drepanopeziza brunnea f. sp. 'multigermtubi' MB_m1]EKD12991.1 hypothetical protein MBM_08753 [Drepanopeziza brunnea f. sp. 'multigermtubi' MB_m1]KAJ5038207.1 hypothetical protein L3040_007074 [Drepanopeziza brunnea f. sp. 'multigermtubi']
MASLVELANRVQIAAEDVSSGKTRDNLALLRGIRNLNRVAESPTDRLRRVLYQTVQNAVVRLAVEIKLPHSLAAAKEMSATELALGSEADRVLVVRLMRVLVAMDIVDEVGEEQYRSNATTEALASPTWTGGTRFLHDTLVPSFATLVDYWHQAGFCPNEGTIFEFAFKQDFWTWHRERPSAHNDFLVYMRGRKDGSPHWLDYFPVASQIAHLSPEPDAVTLVDVGGNLGHDVKLFQQRWPDIPGRLVLMDLPEVVAGNTNVLEGIEKVAYDFFQPQTIIGAKFYLFRAICHDWPDRDCITFLRNTVAAMTPGYSHLLINEQVLPNTGADLHPALLDITMIAYFRAMERTERQWRSLLAAVGDVAIVAIWRLKHAGGGTEAVIDCVRR